MGCCASSANPGLAARNAAKSSSAAAAKGNRSPPFNPVPEEEESVKEVLSETPKRPSAFTKARQENGDPKWIRPVLPAIAKELQNEKKNLLQKQQQSKGINKPVAVAGFLSSEDFPEDDVSAHSVSTNYTDKSEFDGQRSFRQQKSFRSPARRTTEQSPSRGRAAPRARRDSGESSGRRSMSPAKAALGTGPGIARSGSARKAGKSPGRVGPRNEKILKMEEFPGVGRRNRPPTGSSGDESLENPLVSLECFIFL